MEPHSKTENPPRKRGIRASVLFGFVLLATVVFVAANIGQGRRFVELIRSAEPLWLAVALIYQVFTYFFSAAVWRAALDRFGVRVPIGSLALLSLGKLFIDKIIPAAGVSGGVLLVRGLERRGASRPFATGALLVDLLSIYASRGVAAVVAIAILWINGSMHSVVLAVITVFAIVTFSILFLFFRLTKPETTDIPRWAAKVPGLRQVLRAIVSVPPEALRSNRLIWKATLLQLVVLMLDVLTLDVMLRAVGHPTRFDIVFASYSMALVASTISLIPGGIGAFEGISILMLRLLRVPIEAGLAATLMLRAFILWLPMIPGFFVLRRESRHLVE